MPKKIIFVADAFLKDIKGGAELTTEALLEVSPYKIQKVYCTDLNTEFINNNKNVFWIFGNFASLNDKIKMHFINNEQYSVIEYDYKYCKYRSDDLHKKANGNCDCNKTITGKLNSMFLLKSSCLWWMSESQKEHYFKKFPFLEKANNHVLSSVFDERTIKYFENYSYNEDLNRDKWIILDSPSWIKNAEGCKKYAQQNNIKYESVWGIEYNNLLEKLSESKGLIFLPLGKDTCPRITIEAKLLDCELVLNDNVQHKNEIWFQDKKSILSYMKDRKSFFWEEIEKHAQSL